VVVPSVTTILQIKNNPGLVYWYAKNGVKECNRLRNAAGDYGNKIHGIIEAHYGDGQMPKLEGDDQIVSDNFKIFADKHIESFGNFEVTAYNREHMYAGTIDIDCLTLKDGRRVMGDVKTSNRIYNNYYLQAAAYLECDEIKALNLDGAVLLHLDKDQCTWSMLNCEVTDCFEVFLAAKKLYLWNKATGGD
jgi:hypothetical protein